MRDLKELETAVIDGKAKRVKQMILSLIEEGIPAETILNDGLVVGMTEIGRMFKIGEAFVPEMILSAHAMKVGIDTLRPYFVESTFLKKGTVVLGTVEGDLHDIGKNLVGIMMENAGFEVIDLGVDITPSQFADAIETHNADILALSALLTTTMPSMKECIDVLKSRGLRDKVFIMVGGAPVSPEFASEVGADVYTPNAVVAAECAVKYITHMEKVNKGK